MPLHRDLHTPWIRACTRGQVAELEAMSKGEPWPDLVCTTPRTSCLILATGNGHAEVCCRLLAHSPHLEARNDDGQTPLIIAAIEGHAEIVDMLLAAGADPTAVDNDGDTALFCAVRNANIEITRKLLPLASPEQVNRPNKFGASLVDAACHSILPEIMDMVLAAGGNPNTYNAQEGERVMHSALLLDNDVAVRVLARHGARLGHMHNGDSYLHTAVKQRCEETVRALLDAGANPRRQNRQGKTAEELAREVGFSGYDKVLAEFQHDQMQASTPRSNGVRRVRL